MSANNPNTAPTIVDDSMLRCANHPGVETLLRCNKCGKPICLKCAVQTPVGYRCKECVHQQQNVYFNAAAYDNVIALGVAMAVATIATPILGLFLGMAGWFSLIIAFFLGSSAGPLLAQIIRWAIKRRRGRYLRWYALAGVVIGVLLGSLIALFVIGIFPVMNLAVIAFTVLAVATAWPFLK